MASITTEDFFSTFNCIFAFLDELVHVRYNFGTEAFNNIRFEFINRVIHLGYREIAEIVGAIVGAY